MKKPAHKDTELTRLRQELGEYVDNRSWVGLDGREWLAGHDICKRRREVWERDQRCCVKCGEFVTFEEMEMDHIVRRGLGDDSLDNLQTMCGPFKSGCHRGSRQAKHA